MKIPTLTIATVLVLIDAALSGIVPVGVPDVNVRFVKKSDTQSHAVAAAPAKTAAAKSRQHHDNRVTSR